MINQPQFSQFLSGHTAAVIEYGFIFSDEYEIVSLRDAAGLSSEAMLGDLAQKIESSAVYRVEIENFFLENYRVLEELANNAPNLDWFQLGWGLLLTRNGYPDGYGDYGTLNGELLETSAAAYPASQFEFFTHKDSDGNQWFGYQL